MIEKAMIGVRGMPIANWTYEGSTTRRISAPTARPGRAATKRTSAARRSGSLARRLAPHRRRRTPRASLRDVTPSVDGCEECLKMHVGVCWPGLISRFSVVSANAHELSVVPELVESTRRPAVGDRNYHSPKTKEELVRSMGVELLALRREFWTKRPL